jgi:hypothetical protein
MPNIQQEAARSVVRELAPFEVAVDIALARGGRLLASLAEGRIEANVGPATGHAAIMSTLATVTKLAEAREGMVSTRRELVLTRAKLGLQEVAIGSLPGCPGNSASDETPAVTAHQAA